MKNKDIKSGCTKYGTFDIYTLTLHQPWHRATHHVNPPPHTHPTNLSSWQLDCAEQDDFSHPGRSQREASIPSATRQRLSSGWAAAVYDPVSLSLCAQVKEFISSELLAQLCALGDCSELMDESPEQRQHRKQVLRKHAALKEALAVVSNLSTSACSTARPPPVDSVLMQTPR